jgi:hypothetical protein
MLELKKKDSKELDNMPNVENNIQFPKMCDTNTEQFIESTFPILPLTTNSIFNSTQDNSPVINSSQSPPCLSVGTSLHGTLDGVKKVFLLVLLYLVSGNRNSVLFSV